MNSAETTTVRVFALQMLNAAGGVVNDLELRLGLRQAFPRLRLTETQLGEIIEGLDSERWIAGVTDALTRQTVWTITSAGKLALHTL